MNFIYEPYITHIDFSAKSLIDRHTSDSADSNPHLSRNCVHLKKIILPGALHIPKIWEMFCLNMKKIKFFVEQVPKYSILNFC